MDNTSTQIDILPRETKQLPKPHACRETFAANPNASATNLAGTNTLPPLSTGAASISFGSPLTRRILLPTAS